MGAGRPRRRDRRADSRRRHDRRRDCPPRRDGVPEDPEGIRRRHPAKTVKRYDKAYFDKWYRRERVNSPADIRRKVALAVAQTEYWLFGGRGAQRAGGGRAR